MSQSWVPADHGSDRRGLGRSVARGLTWTIVDTWGRQLLNLLVFLLLARLLAPDDFGIVALAAVFVSLAQVIVDQGLGDALIQRREVTSDHVDTAFWTALLTGLVLAALTLILAVPAAMLLDEPDLQPILQVLSITFLLAALSSIQIALLRRQLAFRSLAVRAIVATAAGGSIGVLLAWSGFGPWALVAQQIASAGVSVLVLWTVSPWRPGLRFSTQRFQELFPFGIRVVASDVLSFLSRHTDNFLIGVFLGITALGFYAVGYRILDVSQTLLLNVARKITFPVFARMQGDPDRVVRAYMRVTRVAALVILPGYVALAIVAPDLTTVFFGGRWADSGTVARVLFLIGPVLAIQAFSDTLLNAVGHPEVVLRFRLITTATNVIGFLIAVPFGIVAVAAAFTIRGYLLAPILLRWMRVHAGIPTQTYLVQLRWIAASTSMMALSMLAVRWFGQDWGDANRLVAMIASGAITFLATLRITDPAAIREGMGIARDAFAGQRRST